MIVIPSRQQSALALGRALLCNPPQDELDYIAGLPGYAHDLVEANLI